MKSGKKGGFMPPCNGKLKGTDQNGFKYLVWGREEEGKNNFELKLFNIIVVDYINYYCRNR